MSRMWHGVDPQEMCRNHLLGEHKELHQIVGTINAGIRLGKTSQWVRLDELGARHDALAEEMVARGWNHSAPLPERTEEPAGLTHDPVVGDENREELARRCESCRGRMGGVTDG